MLSVLNSEFEMKSLSLCLLLSTWYDTVGRQPDYLSMWLEIRTEIGMYRRASVERY